MPLSIDSYNKLILVTNPDTAVDAQTLHDFVQDYLASPRGMVEDGTWDQHGEILKPEGKIEDPTNPGVYSQIILILNPEWQIQFWATSGYTRIYGGKITGGVSDQPMKATGAAGDITVLESPVDGVTVAVSGGDGLPVEAAEQLADIHAAHMHRRTRDVLTGNEVIYEADGLTPRKEFTSTDDGSQITEIAPASIVPANALVDRDGNPILDRDGNYIITRI